MTRGRINQLREALADKPKSTRWLVEFGYSITETRRVGAEARWRHKYDAKGHWLDRKLFHFIRPSNKDMEQFTDAVRRRWTRFFNETKPLEMM